jgi:CRISPR system Cascade subunit CasE
VNEPLHMVQMSPDPKALISFLSTQGLNSRTDEDLGYGIHAWLKATFGLHAPKPFRLFAAERGERPPRLLGYTKSNRDELLEHAHTFAEPGARAVCNLQQQFAVTAVPSEENWRPGRQLGFEILVCPVARRARDGRERDLFLHEADRAGSDAGLRREEVYLSWLAERLTGAASLERGSLEGFRLVHQLRQGTLGEDSCRKKVRLVRPQALVRGALTIQDGAAFASLLAGGIGRHRSFGYGMLLLKPAP